MEGQSGEGGRSGEGSQVVERWAISRGHLDAALAPLSTVTVAVDADGSVRYASPQLPSLLGHPPADVEGRSLLDFLHPDDVELVVSALARWDGRAGTVTGPRTRLRHASGDHADVLVDVVSGPAAAPLGAVVAVLRPRDARAELEQALRQHLVHQDRLARFTALFVDRHGGSSHDRVARALVELGGLEYVTRVALFRGDPASMRLDHVWSAPANAPSQPLPDERDLHHDPLLRPLTAFEEVRVDDVAALGDDLREIRDAMLDAGVLTFCAVPLVMRGELRGFLSVEVTLAARSLSNSHRSAIRAAAAVLGDAFAREEAQRALTFRALHDPVTGLANHARFLEALAAEGHPSAPGVGSAVVLVDLDGFKLVNDALGHRVGDALLRHAAAGLATTAPAGALVARLGADDFACLLHGVSGAEALGLAEAMVRSVEGTVSAHEHELRVRARGGVAHDDEVDSGGPASLLGAAEVALAEALVPGAPRVVRFDRTHGAILERRHWVERELPRALERGELALHYQPEVDLASGAVVGVEALLRWYHPEHGLLPAGAFVPHAESMAAFGAVTDWVLRSACEQQVRWATTGAGPGDTVLRMNLSGRDVSRPGLVDRLAEVVEATAVPPERLCVEITETAVLSDPEEAGRTCRDLRALGVQLAIDDFGTGHWSMRSLTDLPIHTVKIDRALVEGIDRSAEGRGVAAAVLALAATLGLDVVAEGIETAAELEVLVDLGCRRGQGFFLGHPVAADAVPLTVALPGGAR